MILDRLAGMGCQRIADRLAILGAIGQKLGHRSFDLVQKRRNRRRITDIILCQLAAHNVAADKVEADMQLAPTPPFYACSILLRLPFAGAEDFQATAVDDKIDRFMRFQTPGAACRQTRAPARQGRKARSHNIGARQPCDRSHKPLRLPQRQADTRRNVRQISIASSE